MFGYSREQTREKYKKFEDSLKPKKNNNTEKKETNIEVHPTPPPRKLKKDYTDIDKLCVKHGLQPISEMGGTPKDRAETAKIVTQTELLHIRTLREISELVSKKQVESLCFGVIDAMFTQVGNLPVDLFPRLEELILNKATKEALNLLNEEFTKIIDNAKDQTRKSIEILEEEARRIEVLNK